MSFCSTNRKNRGVCPGRGLFMLGFFIYICYQKILNAHVRRFHSKSTSVKCGFLIFVENSDNLTVLTSWKSLELKQLGLYPHCLHTLADCNCHFFFTLAPAWPFGHGGFSSFFTFCGCWHILWVICCFFRQQGPTSGPPYGRAEMWSPWCLSWSQVMSGHPQWLMWDKNEPSLCVSSCCPPECLGTGNPAATQAGEKYSFLLISIRWVGEYHPSPGHISIWNQCLSILHLSPNQDFLSKGRNMGHFKGISLPYLIALLLQKDNFGIALFKSAISPCVLIRCSSASCTGVVHREALVV